MSMLTNDPRPSSDVRRRVTACSPLPLSPSPPLPLTASAARVLALLLLLMPLGCSHRYPIDPEHCRVLEELSLTPQEIAAFNDGSSQDRSLGEISVQSFQDSYFSVFRRHEEALDTSRWVWHAFDAGTVLRENLQPAQADWFDLMDSEAAWEQAGNLDKPGISLVTTPLRAMPTEQPLVTDPRQPGQGFQFDHLQNSLINANEPLWLSHRSRSGEWVFVLTSYASGWLRNRDVASIPEALTVSWPQMQPVAFIEEGYPVRDHRGNFLFTSRIGMVLPLIQGDKGINDVLLATAKSPEGEALFEAITLPSRLTVPIPMAPTYPNLATVASSLLGLPYGWGGLFENRDCSAAVRDFFMPFGLWLPRNSREQAVAGRVIKLSNLGEDQKAQLILEEAVPFVTLLQKKGHIALYVGHYDGHPVVLHSVWDLTVKTSKGETRKHFGRIVLSPLRPSSDDGPCGPGTTLLADLDSMNILLPPISVP